MPAEPRTGRSALHDQTKIEQTKRRGLPMIGRGRKRGFARRPGRRAAIALLSSLAWALPVSPAAAAHKTPSFPSADGLQVTSVQRLDHRLYELTVTTSA